MPMLPPFSEEELRAAVAQSDCWAGALRRLGYQPKGSNYRTVRRWATEWKISTRHFDANAARGRATRARERPLAEVMVENSTYSRGQLKERLFAAGLKPRACELCGQGEIWRGQRMSLVLDHINGVSDDHRLENLQVVCPNCAATLVTHCGRNLPRERTCPICRSTFAPRHIRHRYCSQTCVGAANGDRLRGTEQPGLRKVERPSHEQLLADLASMSMCAVGRKYGVSDSAVRKWLRWYAGATGGEGGGEAEAAA